MRVIAGVLQSIKNFFRKVYSHKKPIYKHRSFYPTTTRWAKQRVPINT